jgi:hypothetical protein
MAYRFYHRPIHLLQADLGLDGMDRVDAGESLDITEGTRVTSAGEYRATSTGDTRSVTGIGELGDFDIWLKLEAADPSVAVVLDTGCLVAYGDAPAENTKALGGAPIRVPFTRIVTKAAGGAGMAYRLRKRTLG